MSNSVFTPCGLNLICQIDFHLKYPLCPPFENRFFVFEVAICDLILSISALVGIWCCGLFLIMNQLFLFLLRNPRLPVSPKFSWSS